MILYINSIEDIIKHIMIENTMNCIDLDKKTVNEAKELAAIDAEFFISNVKMSKHRSVANQTGISYLNFNDNYNMLSFTVHENPFSIYIEKLDESELEKVKKMILRINDFMIGMFRGVGIKLIDFKLEFGRLKENGKNEVILADEISPDTCRLWDSITDKKLDKDRFRKDLGDLIPAYTEVARRLGILHEQSNLSAVNVTKLRSVKKRK